jgi:hypothetical protein
MARVWCTQVTSGNCSNAPFSSGTTFSPSYAGLDTTSADFVGALESFNINYGREIQTVNTAELLGATGTVRGVAGGTGEMVVVTDVDNPIGDIIQSGALYDFVVTVGKLVSGVVVPVNATDADAEKITGRVRFGPCQLTLNENGEVMRGTFPYTCHGLAYGLVLGASDS